MNLVGSYNSDSDIDSDSDNQDTQQHNLPQISQEILDKYHKAPSVDMKYKSVFVAPSGYFNSYCSIEFLPTYNQLRLMDGILQNVQMYSKMSTNFQRVGKFIPIYAQNGINTQVHVSLTNNVYLDKESKDKFQKELKNRLIQYKYIKGINEIKFKNIRFLWNSSNSKIFLTLGLDSNSANQINKLGINIKESLESSTDEVIIGGPIFDHGPDTYHLTIAETESIVEDKGELNFLEQLNEEVEDIEVDESLYFTYDSLKVNNGLSRISIDIGDYSHHN